jgi:hypothetical protein
MTHATDTIMVELDKRFDDPEMTEMTIEYLWEIWALCGKPWDYPPPKKCKQVTRDEALAYARHLCPGYRDPREVEILRREVARLRKSLMECNMEEVRQLRQEVAKLKEIQRNWREEYFRLYDKYIRTKPSAPAIPEHYATLHLLPGAPPEVVSAVHKALTRLHHPDLGGDTATMQAINAAVDKVRKEVQS